MTDDTPQSTPTPPPFGVPSADEVAPAVPAAPAAPTAPPAYTPPPAPVRKRGIGGRVAAAVIGVAVVGGGLAYAVGQAGDGGGASSPEAAAQQLFEAISDEDLIGVLDLLPAGERRAFQDPIEDVADELGRLGVLSDGLDLSDIAGIDLDFEDMEFTSEDLGPGVAAVSVAAGTFSLELDPDELPLGRQLVDLIEDMSGEPLEIDPVEESDEFTPGQDSMTLVAVEGDDGWHISFMYSIAEAVRGGSGLDVPDFGNGVQPMGHESPEAAVEALLSNALALDVEAVIAQLPPDEMAVLHDYAPLFLDDLDGLQDEVPFAAGLTDVDLEADTDGDTASVAITGFAFDLEIDGDAGSVAFDGDCFVIDGPDGSEEMCNDDLTSDFDDLDLPIDLDPEEVAGIATVKVDGEWYVSPTRTLLGSVVAMLRAFDDDAVSRIPEIMEELFRVADDFATDSGFDSSLGGVIGGDFGDDLDFDEDFGDDSGDDFSHLDLEDPEWNVLFDMLVEDQGFTTEEAGCIADEIYLSDFDDRTLSVLQTGEIPEAVEEQIFDIVGLCIS